MSRINTNRNKLKNYYLITLPNEKLTICYSNEKIIKRINHEMLKLGIKR